jgi:hypothetical protein
MHLDCRIVITMIRTQVNFKNNKILMNCGLSNELIFKFLNFVNSS